jgi:hypothetical protein
MFVMVKVTEDGDGHNESEEVLFGGGPEGIMDFAQDVLNSNKTESWVSYQVRGIEELTPAKAMNLADFLRVAGINLS